MKIPIFTDSPKSSVGSINIMCVPGIQEIKSLSIEKLPIKFSYFKEKPVFKQLVFYCKKVFTIYFVCSSL